MIPQFCNLYKKKDCSPEQSFYVILFYDAEELEYAENDAHCTIQDINLPKKLYHSIYYDAFAPQFQPELWSKDIFDKLRQASSPHAILTTYCCKGDVKRALKAAGYTIEKLPGPKGKREMLRAKIENQPTVKLYKQSL